MKEIVYCILFYGFPLPPSQVVLLGMDILSALVSRLQERFRTQVGTGEPMFLVQTTNVQVQKNRYF